MKWTRFTRLAKRREPRPDPDRRHRGLGKHLAFYRVLDACARPECPICYLTRLRVERYFEGLLYEKVNDLSIRDRFRAAGGFCNAHSHQFMGYSDVLAGSIMYRDLLSTWLRRRDDLPVQSSSGALPGCPACIEKTRTEDTYLSVMVKFLDDEQMKTALLSSDGLCLPHLVMMERKLRGDRRGAPDWLVDFHRDLLERILHALDACVDSCNFSLGDRRPQLSREQELTWKRALRKIAGFSLSGGNR